MKKQIEIFQEIPDEIPYRKVTEIRIISVTYTNQNYQILLDRKCQNLPEESKYLIIRKSSDFRWLVQQINKQSNWAVVIPLFTQSNWSIMQSIGVSEVKKWLSQTTNCRIVQRFLKIISKITLKSVYRHGFTRSSLYTFFDKSYQLYRLQKYQNNQKQKQKQIANISKLSSIANTIGKGSMKILGMLNVLKTQTLHKYLQSIYKQFFAKKSDLQNFILKLNQIQESIKVLQGNFLNEQKQLKQKQQKIFQLYMKIQSLLKLIIQSINQMTEVQKKIKLFENKNDDDKLIIKQQLESYQKFLNDEFASIDQQTSLVMEQFFETCFSQTIDIKISNLYPCKI